MNLAATLRGTTYRFRDLKEVLAKANEEKSGDRLAGLAAASVSERIAAKRVLASVTLAELHENPVVPAEVDAVTRLILDDLQLPIYDSVKSWTVAELREHVLADTTSGADLLRLSRGLTSEMIAACAKLMTNLDLVYAARKIRVVVHATNTVGLPERLSVRLQPNHPSDSIEGIMASLREGLSYGAGDAVIGINPVDRRSGDDGEDPERHRRLHAAVAHPHAELLPGARHDADEGAGVGRAARPDVPVDRRDGEGAAQLRRDAAAARRGVRHDAEAGAVPGAERDVLRDRPGLGAVGRRARRGRSDDAGGAQLRPGPPLRPFSRQHGGRLHRPGVPLRRPADHPRRRSRITSWGSCTASRWGATPATPTTPTPIRTTSRTSRCC